MKYRIVATKQYRKAFKKIKNNKKLQLKIKEVLEILGNDLKIPKSYRDYKLVGNLKDFRELHIEPDFLLIYRKEKEMLILFLARMGSHSDLF